MATTHDAEDGRGSVEPGDRAPLGADGIGSPSSRGSDARPAGEREAGP